MGRKIPGKKHRSIVDPEKQRAKRIASLKNKINNPPQNSDDQEVPKSVLKIIELKKACAKNEEKIKRRRKRRKEGMQLTMQQFLDKDEPQPGMNVPDRFIPNLIQRPLETPEKFLSRVNSVSQKIIKEVEFENKFGVKIKKDMKTGKVIKVEKDKGGKLLKKKKEKDKKRILLQKKKEKKKKKTNESFKDFGQLKDNVEFGEVVHRPPVNLKLNKKLKQSSKVENKSKYENLLLKSLLR